MESCTESQVIRLMQDWDSLEPITESTPFKEPLTPKKYQLLGDFARYIKNDILNPLSDCALKNIDFEEILSNIAIDPEQALPMFTIEKDNLTGNVLWMKQFHSPFKKTNNLKPTHPYWKSPKKLSEDKDFQDFIENIPHIRTVKGKTKNEIPAKSRTKKHYTPMPLLIEDILQIKLDSGFLSEQCIYGHSFRTVMFYGRVCPLGCKAKGNIRMYKIDDGTASVTVHFSHGHKRNFDNLQRFNRISSVVESTKQYGINVSGQIYKRGTKDYKEVMKSIETFLKILRNRVYAPLNYFKLGKKAVVIGTPYKHISGELHIWAFQMYEDGDINRDYEIFFKTMLIDLYECKYYKYTIDNQLL